MTQPAPPPGTENPRAAAKAAKAYAKASRPWYRKKRFIGLIALGLVVVIAVATSGGGGSGGTAGPDAEEPPTVGSVDSPIAIGESVELEGTRYTVRSAETADSVGDEFSRQDADGAYVVVELTIENLRDETRTFSDSAAVVVGGNDREYSTDSDGSFAIILGDVEPLIFEDMQPEVPKTGRLVFDLPPDATAGSVLKVSDLFGRGEAYIDLGLS